MVKGKMTKHDMKEDRFVTSMAHGMTYARENVQSVIIIVVLFLVFVAGIVILMNFSAGRKENAQKMLGVAQIAYKAGDYLEARDSLLVLQERYSKSKPAKVACFLLGHIYFATGSPDSAEIFWKDFLDRKPIDQDMIIGAEAGLAGITSDRGDYQAAAVEFERIYNEYPNYFDRGNILYKAAIHYHTAGEREKARALLSKFIDDYPNNPMITKAKFFISAMEAA